MFDFAKPNQKQIEEKMLDKQINAGKEQALVQSGSDPNTDMAYLEMNKQKEDLVRWQQNLLEELFYLELDLKRQYLNQEGDIIDSGQTPACNEKCIQMIRTCIRPLISRNMMMTNFNEERILQMLKRSCAAVVRNICLQFDLYKIDYFDISYIITTIKNYILPAPFRALNDGERRHNREVIRRVETFADKGEEDKKKGLFSFK